MVLLHATTLLYNGQIRSAWLYITLTWIYFNLLDSTFLFHRFTSLFLTLPSSTTVLLHSTWLYSTLPWFYLTLLDSSALHHSYTILDSSLIALFYSTWLYITLPKLYFCLLDSTVHLPMVHFNLYTWLYITLPLIYFIYLNLHYCSIVLLHSNWLYWLLP